ncbi:MAG: hypothetical protein GF411_00020 [Candidatus Lokiarchaeota archaeon]|nr:hypothetical protein [Candidatus Lokiarchaeota archaeon]
MNRIFENMIGRLAALDAKMMVLREERNKIRSAILEYMIKNDIDRFESVYGSVSVRTNGQTRSMDWKKLEKLYEEQYKWLQDMELLRFNPPRTEQSLVTKWK